MSSYYHARRANQAAKFSPGAARADAIIAQRQADMKFAEANNIGILVRNGRNVYYTLQPTYTEATDPRALVQEVEA